MCFRFALAAALTGALSPPGAVLTFVQLAAVGVAAGVGLTYGVTWFKGWVGGRLGEESGSQVLVSLLVPFGAYELAEHLGGSGILASRGRRHHDELRRAQGLSTAPPCDANGRRAILPAGLGGEP